MFLFTFDLFGFSFAFLLLYENIFLAFSLVFQMKYQILAIWIFKVMKQNGLSKPISEQCLGISEKSGCSYGHSHVPKISLATKTNFRFNQ
jgi:hypothetical protein